MYALGTRFAMNAQERGIFMCRVKGNKKWLAVVLFFAVIAASMGRGVTSQAAGKSTKQGTNVSAAKKAKAQKAYKKYAQQQAKSGKQLYYAIVNASANGMPVLLISKSTDVFGTKQKFAVTAKVYSYSAGKVVYVTKMQSTGTSYPLLKHGKYILSGWHHKSYQLKVSGAKGYVKAVEGFSMEASAKCYKSSWTVRNGKKSSLKKTEISQKKAGKLDYYCTPNGNYGGTEIEFHKVTR